MNIAKPSSGFNIKISDDAKEDIKTLIKDQHMGSQHWNFTLKTLKNEGHKLGIKKPQNSYINTSAVGDRIFKVTDLFAKNKIDIYIHYFVLGDQLSVQRLTTNEILGLNIFNNQNG